jgi:hypothetical protein
LRELRVMYEHTPPWEAQAGTLPAMATIQREGHGQVDQTSQCMKHGEKTSWRVER